MIEAAVANNVPQTSDGASLVIECAKDDPGNTGLHRGSGAHGTRFQRDDEGAAVETPVAQLIGGFAQGHNFGVCGGIGVSLTAVCSPADDGTGWIKDHGTYRDVRR